MPTKQGPTFQSIIHDLKSRKFSPIYVLMGDESYYIDQISDYIATDMARRYPMMSEYQVIIVKEAQNIRSLDALEKYLKNPVKSTILVWCHKNGKIDARKKVVGLAQTVGVVFESQKLRDYQLPEFIQNYLKQKKVSIDPKSCQMIADHIGADLNRLTSELDKVLISLSPDNLRVTPEIVEEQIGVSKDFNAFELRNAIVQRDVFKANQIIKYFDNNPKAGSLYSFLPLLFSYFQNLMIAYYAPQKNTEQGIATALDLRSSWGAKDFLIGLKNYSARKTMDIISKIRDTDAKSKGLDNPNTGVGDLMKELIFFILH